MMWFLDGLVRVVNAVVVPDRLCPGRPIDWGDRIMAVGFVAVVAAVTVSVIGGFL